MRTIFFVDTNLFIQCRDVKSLPWRDISETDHIVVMIARPVQAELDRLKGDGNSRRAKRARAANTTIREILSNESMSLVIENSESTISLTFPPDYSKDQLGEVGEWVDISRPDHELVAIAALYRKANPNDQVFLLTNDTLPTLTAKRYGLPWRHTPEDWQLPPEQDDKDKRIGELQYKLEKIERRQPIIEVTSSVSLENLGPENLVTLRNYQKVTDTELNKLIAVFTEDHPLKTSFPREEKDLSSSERNLARLGAFGGLFQYYPPSDDEIAEYRDVEYPKWIAALRQWVETTQQNLIETCRYIPIRFDIANTGDAPLANCLVEFFVYNDIAFCPPEIAEKLDDLFKVPDLPKPPSPPRGAWRDTSSIFGRLSSLLPRADVLSAMASLKGFPILSPSPPRRNTHSFYWIGGRPSTPKTDWDFECEEFRHKVEPEQFNMYLYFPVDCSEAEASVKCRVTGANLISPFSCYLKINFKYQEQRIIEEISKIVEERS